MTLTQEIIRVAMVVLATMLTRFLPFLLFPNADKTPAYIRYLGRVLTPAIFGLLAVYGLKDLDMTSSHHGLPEIIASLVVIGLHFWRKNMLLSIAAGTILYMVYNCQ